MDVITTVPNVSYRVFDKKGNMTRYNTPRAYRTYAYRPHRRALHTCVDYHRRRLHRPIMTLCLGKRGELINQQYISGNRIELTFDSRSAKL
ncbi:hypothetical protein [Muribaculum intestinale]|uniref:hypothetical protein n=1 Tax=Muribaculum intestinale TaxID=1796646 RepID=UPI003F678308